MSNHTFVAHALTVQPRLKQPFAFFLWSVTSVLWLFIGYFSCFCSTASNSNRSTPACSPVLRKRSRSPTPQSPEGENMVEKNSDHSSDKPPSTPEQAVQRTYSQSLHNTRTGGKNSKVNVWLTVLTVLLLSPSSYTACLAHLLLLWGQIPHPCRLVNSILSVLQVIYTSREDHIFLQETSVYSFPVNLLKILVSCLSREQFSHPTHKKSHHTHTAWVCVCVCERQLTSFWKYCRALAFFFLSLHLLKDCICKIKD